MTDLNMISLHQELGEDVHINSYHSKAAPILHYRSSNSAPTKKKKKKKAWKVLFLVGSQGNSHTGRPERYSELSDTIIDITCFQNLH